MFGSKLSITNGVFPAFKTWNILLLSTAGLKRNTSFRVTAVAQTMKQPQNPLVFSAVFQLSGTNINKDKFLLAKTNRFYSCSFISIVGSKLQQLCGRNTNSPQKKKSGKQEADTKPKEPK